MRKLANDGPINLETMRNIPDWWIQVTWWVAGIFATGAGWYFLSTKDYAFAVVSGIAAVLLAAFAVVLHKKKDAYVASLVPVELQDDLPDNYVRRSTDRHEQVRLVQVLPELKAVVRRSSSAGWDSGVTTEMREANYDMIDFLEFAWLKLSEFYPRKHFGRTDAQKYVEKYIRDRFSFHWAKNEPAGPGSGGTIASVITGGDVINDLETLIEGLMQSLFFDTQYLDLNDWLRRWRATGN